MEVNMTEQNKQYRLTSLEEPTDEMLFELMAGVENIAKISSAKAEAEKKRRLQAVAEEILAWRANQSKRSKGNSCSRQSLCLR